MTVAIDKANIGAAESSGLRSIDRALVAFLQREYPQASAAQCGLAGLVSRQLAHGHLCLPLDTADSRREAEACCGELLERLLDDNPLVSTDGATPLVREGNRLYLLRYWRLETRLAAAVTARVGDVLLEAQAMRAPLEQLFAGSVEQPDWQQVACALAGRTRLGIITGGPGTGKTTTVVRLLALLQQLAMGTGVQPLMIELAAPTGKAAARLETSIGNAVGQLSVGDSIRQALPTRVRTLHRLLGTRRHSRHFRHNHRNPLVTDLVVVDEASMVDIDMMAALLDALPASSRLILVGDKDQLASVEAGAVMAELCATADQTAYDADTVAFVAAATDAQLPITDNAGSALAQQIVKLQKNWRSKDAPGIGVLADAVNRQDAEAAATAFTEYPQQLQRRRPTPGWIKRELIDGDTGIAALLQHMRNNAPDAQTAEEQIDAWANKLLARTAWQQLLTPLRRGRDGIEGLNQRIINQLHRGGLIDNPTRFAGQPLLITSNLYDLGLMNGDLGLVLDHPMLGQRVAFAGRDSVRWILPDQLEGYCQPAYALSVHQSQGSEFRRVLLHLPSHALSEQASRVLTKELVYTAVTRASRMFVLLDGQAAMLDDAINTRTQRHSGLAARLHGG